MDGCNFQKTYNQIVIIYIGNNTQKSYTQKIFDLNNEFKYVCIKSIHYINTSIKNPIKDEKIYKLIYNNGQIIKFFDLGLTRYNNNEKIRLNSIINNEYEIKISFDNISLKRSPEKDLKNLKNGTIIIDLQFSNQ